MKSAMVTDVSMQAVMTVQGQGKNQNDSLPNFADFMQSGSRPSDNVMIPAPAKSDAGDAQAAYQRSDRKAADVVAKNVNQSEPAKETDARKVTKKAEGTEQDIVKDISDELGVSEEDVEAAMEILGLTAADLMQQGNMTQLIAQITDVQPVDILTDESLFSQMEMLTDDAARLFNEAAQELGMSTEELAAAIEEAAGRIAEVSASDDAPVISDDIAPVAQDTTPVVEIVNEPVMTAEEIVRDVQTKDRDAASDVDSAVQSQTPVEEVSEQTEQAMTQDKHDSGTRDRKGHDAAQTGNAGVAQAVSDIQNAPVDFAQTESVYERFNAQQTQSIIDQIADYVKINHGRQLTEMELQLNPASLGTIHLQIASKAGTISAQLIAQDQAVAAALEGHLVQLRESLEAQGMKVDAVEVTVASHEFEQNLDSQGRQQEEDAQRAAAGKHRRILDLSDFTEDGELAEEELSDADRLQVEMMRMGGSRLNLQI